MRYSLFDPPVQSTGRYPPFDFDAANQVQNPPDITEEEPQDQPANSGRLADLYKQITSANAGPAQKKYQDFLDTAEPDRANFKPSKMGRLSAMLAGASEGIKNGGAAGYATSRGIIDEPYQQELGRYNNQGKKLQEAATLEDKDITNRVNTYKTILADDKDQATRAELKRVNDARIRNYDSQSANRGIHYEKLTNPNDGHVTSVKLGPDGSKTNVDLGIGAFTPDELTKNAGAKAGAESTATEGSRIRVARAGIQERGAEARKTLSSKFASIEDLLQFKKDNGIGDKYESKTDKNGMLIYVNRSDPNDIVTTDIDTGKMSDADKQKAKITLKQTPAAGTNTTTTRTDSRGRTTTTKTERTPIEGGDKTKVDVVGPNGERGKMDATEFEEAQKHGWKKK